MSVMIEYIPSSGFIHRLNPLTKVTWTFSVLIISFLFNEPLPIFLVFLSNIVIAASAGVLGRLMPVLKGLAGFAAILIFSQVFFIDEGNLLFYLVPYTRWGGITDTGLKFSLVMALRMLSSVSAIPIVMLSTPLTDLVHVLVVKLRVPFKYAFMFITALRFVPVFLSELEQILSAQMSRGYQSDTKNPFKKFIIILPLAIPLLVSSAKKTENMGISMEVRGFGTGQRSHYRELDLRRADYITLWLFALTVTVSIIFKFQVL